MRSFLKAYELIEQIKIKPANEAGTMRFYPRQFADPNILPLAPCDIGEGNSVSGANPFRSITLHAPDGFPYGCFARMSISYLVTLILRQRKAISICTSRRTLFEDVVGQEVNGQKQLLSFVDVFLKLVTADIYIREARTRDGKVTEFRTRAVFSDLTSWDKNTSINFDLSDSFVKLVLALQPHPIDHRVLRFLWQNRSPLGMDLYCWIVYRAPSTPKNKPLFLNWQQLQLLFPNEWQRVSRPSVFKNRLQLAMNLVQLCYPDLQIGLNDKGMLLKKSKHHIPPRSVKE